MRASTTPSETATTKAFTVPTDALLIQAVMPAGAIEDLAPLLQRLQCVLQHSPLRLHAAFSPAKRVFYTYLYLAERTPMEKAAADSLESALKREWSQLNDVRVSRLERVFEAAGTSASVAPAFHYAVEMDPEPGWMPALSQWYDTEHMPGLAAVRGCIRATRFLNHDHGPLSLACYDLVTEETLGSAPWLAVRGTEWSSRMRPRFTNTIRTMFTVLPPGMA